ncbi:DUF2484 family protein [Cereibacter sphaeroides]|uniref:DUF2484 family protein n=1 Tax=Rhodobacterales TaxID=204455 RepID=UPI000BBF1068|nr:MULTISPECIES: DUF2484 family protein [Paracoccaceae]MCE6951649.1 DUF2484 family protein [Cereibacter sphaeroides]MCE6960287.1 DUF2484 family protein [Cereibacter sphaeroides]MCE6969162.1 DUF2484 family protein [Cereibacter sphaeroides]MCE6974898.1 DUF2484 family protein [Cereibacter sphaeroides]
MTGSLAASFGWIIAASAVALLPDRARWLLAALLIAGGIPLLGWVTYQNGPYWGMLALAAGAAVLRWPMVRAWNWLRRRLPRHAE